MADAAGHRANVETLAEKGILEGTECGPGQFCPKEPIQRLVMAVWLVRAVDGSDPADRGSSRFEDVDVSQWWSPFVERLADLGITRGCSTEPARFCPTDPVTRQQMASFLVRAFQLEPEPENKFTDVEDDNSHLVDINGLAAAGITAGCATEPARFCPGEDTTRAEMATFLARALGIATTPPTEPEPQPKEGDFTAIAAGSSHTCGIKADGTIVCWGENDRGQADPPPGEFTTLAGGDRHSCGIRIDQTVTCWGANWAGQLDAPEGAFSAVSAGWNHSCGLRTNGSVTCWGANNDGQLNTPEGAFTTVVSGSTASCGLRTDGQALCWGANGYGQTDAPTDEFTSIATGGQHSCGVRTNGTVLCWGENSWGQADPPARRFATVAAGTNHTCGVHSDQTVTCWGANGYGQADPPEDAFHSIAVGYRHSCGLRTNGTVLCWGLDYNDRTDPTQDKFSSLTAGRTHLCGLRTDQTITCWGHHWEVGWGGTVPPQGTFTAVATGNNFACAVRSKGTVTCWGENQTGQADPPSGAFAGITTGSAHSCGIRTDKTITCWGSNEDGQASPPEGEFTAIAAGASHTCGLRGTDQALVCWGRNEFGQASPPEGEFTAVSTGDWHSCGLRFDGVATCWGYNGNGRDDPPTGDFTAIAAGGDHSCGLRIDQTVVCWGADDHGESEPPEEVFVDIAAGNGYSCGLVPDRTVICWGRLLVVPTPVDVEHLLGLSGPDPAMCRPPGSSGSTAGFPLRSGAAPSLGTLRVAVLFVDFPDAPATHTTQREAELGLSDAEKYVETVSYKNLDLQFVPLHRWLRAPHNYEQYLDTSVLGGLRVGGEIDTEAVHLADPEFDFTDIDAVMVVMPSSQFAGGTASGTVPTEEGTIWNTSRINNNPRDEAGQPTRWGFTAAHELMHNLGLADLYPYDQDLFERPDASDDQIWVRAGFGLMGLRVFFPASHKDPRLAFPVPHPDGRLYTAYANFLKAGEMLAWSRWQLGWLEPTQIHCLPELETETTLTLSPVAAPGNGPAMIALPLSDTKVLVIESRRKLGYDAGIEERYSGQPTTVPALAEEGVLVYTVDAALGSGQLPLKIAGDPGSGQVDSYPLLTDGQSVTIGDYTITVKASYYESDTVTISRTASPN